MENLKRLSILYAEDETTMRLLTDKILSKRVKKIVSVENGEEALNAFDKEHFDVVITDIGMPFLDGAELINKIKEKNSKVKTIILSGNTHDSESQADFYMAKPINKKSLLEKLEEFALEI